MTHSICSSSSGQFWNPSRACAFVKKIFPEEPFDNYEKNIELLSNFIHVTPNELKEYIDPCFVAHYGYLLSVDQADKRFSLIDAEEYITILVPAAIQAEMKESRKTLKCCDHCGRGCEPGAYCGANRHVRGWDLID
jgi:hypothetical protein